MDLAAPTVQIAATTTLEEEEQQPLTGTLHRTSSNSSSLSQSSTTARKRVSSLGTRTGLSTTTSSLEGMNETTTPPVRLRHSASSPVASPTFQQFRKGEFSTATSSAAMSGENIPVSNNMNGSSASASMSNHAAIPSATLSSAASAKASFEYPSLDLGRTVSAPNGTSGISGATFHIAGPSAAAPTRGALVARRNAAIQRKRLIWFGTIVLSLSSLLWFSVYQRHTIWGSNEVRIGSVSSSHRGPWIVIAMVVSFLGLAAICAGIAIKKEEDDNRVRIVRGDSVLGMIAAEHDREAFSVEPTTPQRVWAMKAISEVNDRL